jgi:glutamate-1-semialdehyde 2,1-aminomutase
VSGERVEDRKGEFMSVVGGPSRSEELLQEAVEFMPGGVNSGRRRISPPLYIRRTQGAYVEDVDGNRYIDYTGGAGTIILGYCYPEVVDRVYEAVKEVSQIAVGGTEGEVALARKIVEVVPSVEQVLFCNSGSEATLNAIRVARAVTGRDKVIKFQGCYHGFHDYVLMNNQSDPGRANKRDPNSAGMLDAAVDNTLVCRYNDLEDVERVLRENEGQVAAILVEPIAHNAPGILPKPGFHEGLRELCDREGSLFIFDEVITGFRHHLGGYQAIAGIDPDLSVFGKAIANGFTIAVLGGKRRYMERFNTNPEGDVVWAGTYNGNPAGVAAALATIELLEDGEVHEHIFGLGERLRAGLVEIAHGMGTPAVACGYGSLFVLCFMDGPVESYDDILRNDAELFVSFRREMIARGILEIPDPKTTRNHVTYSHTDEDVDRTLEAAEGSLRAALDTRKSGGTMGARPTNDSAGTE